MGVRGLFSFAENKFDCFESTTLKDTKLIIDGNNLRFFLYKRTKKRRCSFGGEYLLYFNATRDYFNRYVSICTCELFCSIQYLFIVLKGLFYFAIPA